MKLPVEKYAKLCKREAQNSIHRPIKMGLNDLNPRLNGCILSGPGCEVFMQITLTFNTDKVTTHITVKFYI